MKVCSSIYQDVQYITTIKSFPLIDWVIKRNDMKERNPSVCNHSSRAMSYCKPNKMADSSLRNSVHLPGDRKASKNIKGDVSVASFLEMFQIQEECLVVKNEFLQRNNSKIVIEYSHNTDCNQGSKSYRSNQQYAAIKSHSHKTLEGCYFCEIIVESGRVTVLKNNIKHFYELPQSSFQLYGVRIVFPENINLKYVTVKRENSAQKTIQINVDKIVTHQLQNDKVFNFRPLEFIEEGVKIRAEKLRQFSNSSSNKKKIVWNCQLKSEERTENKNSPQNNQQITLLNVGSSIKKKVMKIDSNSVGTKLNFEDQSQQNQHKKETSGQSIHLKRNKRNNNQSTKSILQELNSSIINLEENFAKKPTQKVHTQNFDLSLDLNSYSRKNLHAKENRTPLDGDHSLATVLKSENSAQIFPQKRTSIKAFDKKPTKIRRITLNSD